MIITFKNYQANINKECIIILIITNENLTCYRFYLSNVGLKLKCISGQFINKVVSIRMSAHEELIGADFFEHDIRHPGVGVSRAVSVLKNYHRDIDETLEPKGFNKGENKIIIVVYYYIIIVECKQELKTIELQTLSHNLLIEK